MNRDQKLQIKSQLIDRQTHRPKIICPEPFVLGDTLKSKWKHRENGCTETYDTRKYRTKE